MPTAMVKFLYYCRSPRWFSCLPRNLLTLGREFESRRSLTNWGFSSHHVQLVKNDYFVGTQNSTSRSTRERDGWILLAIKFREAPQKEGGEILCDPGWCVHKSDVQNKWDDKTMMHASLVHRYRRATRVLCKESCVLPTIKLSVFSSRLPQEFVKRHEICSLLFLCLESSGGFLLLKPVPSRKNAWYTVL